MADTTEKKTYIIKIESNLEKYTKDAAEAKIVVDNLTASTTALKKAGLDNTQEYQLQVGQLKIAKQEYTNLQKVVAAGIQLTNKELSYRQQLTAAQAISIQRIKDLGSGIIKNAQGIDVINPKLIQERKNLAELNLELIKHDQSLNSGSTNVGRYGQSVSAAFSTIGASIKESILSYATFGVAIGLVTTAFNKLKESFFSTDEGIGVLKRWTELGKVYFHSLLKTIRGEDFNFRGNVAAADAAVQQLELLRIQERGEKVRVQQLETEVKLLRLKAAGIKDLKEQMVLYTLADKKEDERIKIKTDHLKAELEWKQVIWMQTKDANLADEIAAGHAELIAIEGEKNLRIQTKIAAVGEKIVDQKKKENDAIIEGQKKLQEEVDKYQKETRERNEKYVEDLIKQAEKEAEASWKTAYDFGKSLFDKNQKDAEIAWNNMLERDKKEIEQTKKKEEVKQKLIQAGIQGAQAGADAIFQMQTNRLNAQMTAELSNVNLTESQKIAISRKYYKEQQKMAITQAIINGALGVTNALATGLPVVKWIEAAAVAVATLAQIAVIKSQSFDGGGTSAPTAITTTPTAQKATSTPVGSSIINPTLSQGQVNAIPNFNPLTAQDIAEIIKNMPSPIVSVQDINKVQANKNKVEVRANI
jgi:hypothetical protein